MEKYQSITWGLFNWLTPSFCGFALGQESKGSNLSRSIIITSGSIIIRD